MLRSVAAILAGTTTAAYVAVDAAGQVAQTVLGPDTLADGGFVFNLFLLLAGVLTVFIAGRKFGMWERANRERDERDQELQKALVTRVEALESSARSHDSMLDKLREITGLDRRQVSGGD